MKNLDNFFEFLMATFFMGMTFGLAFVFIPAPWFEDLMALFECTLDQVVGGLFLLGAVSGTLFWIISEWKDIKSYILK